MSIVVICFGVLALSLAFGVAWINTRLAGMAWIVANFLGYQWAVETTRMDPDALHMAVNLTLVLLVIYLSVMALSGIGAAHLMKRAQRAHGA